MRCQELCYIVMSQLHSSRPQQHSQHGCGCKKNTSRAEEETQWALPARASVCRPIRKHWAFGAWGLKDIGTKIERLDGG